MPLSARIGIYLSLAGPVFDLSLHYTVGVECLVPGVGIFSAFLLPLGLTLLLGTVFFQFIQLRRERTERISVTCESKPFAAAKITDAESISPYFQWNFQRAQILPAKPAFTSLPAFGLVCALVLSWLVMLHMVFYQFGRFRTEGLSVFVMKSVPHTDQSDRWAVPLVLKVRVSGLNLPPKLYLNSKPLSWEELDSSLRAELSKQPAKVVYVEADTNLSWQDALRAIDAAHGLQARVVLLTSATEPRQH
jgi:biopolymer transport protein ExbD